MIRAIILAALVLWPTLAMADSQAPPAPGIFLDSRPSPILVVPAFSGVLTISGCCAIHHDGHVTIAEGVTLDDASRRFWDAVSQLGLQNCKPPPPGKTTP